MPGAVELSCDICHHKGLGLNSFYGNPCFLGPRAQFQKEKQWYKDRNFFCFFLNEVIFIGEGALLERKDNGVIEEEVHCVWKESEGLTKGIPCVKALLTRRTNTPTSKVLHLFEGQMLGKLEEYCMIRTQLDILLSESQD